MLRALLPAVLSVVVLAGLGSDALAAGGVIHANENDPGSAIDLQKYLSKSESTLLFIHSPHCGPCRRISPKIDALAKKKPDLKVVDVILDSKKAHGIGWDSAAAKQFNIHSVPQFMVYDKNGQLRMSGDKAEDEVDAWLVEYKLKKPGND